jgi:Flp pilus assembly protein TadB
MRRKLKSCALVFCLFTFLLIVLGGGLHLNPSSALVAAATGTPVLIYAFNRLRARPRELPAGAPKREVLHDGNKLFITRRRG